MTSPNSNRTVWAADSAELVAIATDDSWAHAANDLTTLAADVATAKGPVDIFDRSGNQYTPVFDDKGGLRDLEKIPGLAANPNLVFRRLANVVRHVRQWLVKHKEPTDGLPSLDAMGPAAAALPGVLGSFYLSPDNPGGGTHTPGSVLHNALHRAGWDHD